MGILDIFRHNKIKDPIFFNEHEDLRLKSLDELIDKVGDDQKAKLEEEKNYVLIGLSGEKNVIYELMHSSYPLVFLHDITLENGFHDSQIDFIVITKKGLIVLETKKLIGDITIDNEGNFIRYFKNSNGEVYKKEGIYSPLTQNRYHVDALKNLLSNNKFSKNIPIYSLVVIANAKTIINKKYAKEYIKKQVIKFDQLNEYIANLIQSDNGIDISDTKMLEIAEVINNNDTKKSFDYIKKFNLKLIEKNNIEETIVIDETNDTNYDTTDTLYESLKKYRFNKSKEQNIPAYKIFTNETLSNIVLSKPKTKNEFIFIPGLSEEQYDKYGKDIINIIYPDIVIDDVNNKENIQITKEIEEKLYKKLRQYRYNKAQELKYEPYFIFSNAVLDAIIQTLPKTKEELLLIKGFGEKKVELYGKDIIDIITYEITK